MKHDYALIEHTDPARFAQDLERRLDAGWEVVSYSAGADGAEFVRSVLLRRVWWRSWLWGLLTAARRKAVTQQ